MKKYRGRKSCDTAPLKTVLRIRLCRDPANVSTLFGLGTNWKEPEFVNIIIRIVVRWPNGPAAGIWEYCIVHLPAITYFSTFFKFIFYPCRRKCLRLLLFAFFSQKNDKSHVRTEITLKFLK